MRYVLPILLVLASCALWRAPERPAPPDPGACSLASVAAQASCPKGQAPTEACIAATARAIEACRLRDGAP